MLRSNRSRSARPIRARQTSPARKRFRNLLLAVLAGCCTGSFVQSAEPGGLPNEKRVLTDDLNLSINKQQVWNDNDKIFYSHFQGHTWNNVDLNFNQSVNAGFVSAGASLNISSDGRVGVEFNTVGESPTLDVGFTGTVDTAITKLQPNALATQHGRHAAVFNVDAAVKNTNVDIQINKMKFAVEAKVIADVRATATASAHVGIDIDVPGFNVNPLSHFSVPGFIPSGAIPGSWDDDIFVGGWDVYDNTLRRSASTTLIDINEDLTVITLSPEQITVLGQSFDTSTFVGDDNYIDISSAWPRRDSNPPDPQVKKGVKSKVLTAIQQPRYSQGGLELNYDPTALTTTQTSLGTRADLTHNQTPLTFELDLDGLITTKKNIPFELTFSLPDIPAIDIPLPSFNVPVVDFGGISGGGFCIVPGIPSGCAVRAPSFSFDPPAISVDVDPASILGISNPLRLGPWDTLDAHINLIDVDLFQDIDQNEDYDVTPHLIGNYTFNDDVLVWANGKFNAVAKGDVLEVLLDSTANFDIYPIYDGQDLTQLDVAVDYQLRAQVQSDVSFGPGDIGLDVTILNGHINSDLIPGGRHGFGPLVDQRIRIASLNFLQQSVSTDISLNSTPQPIAFSVTHDGATSRMDDLRFSNGGNVMSTNLLGSFIDVTGQTGENGQTGTRSGDGGHGGYAGAVDVSESDVDEIGVANLGLYNVRGGDGGNGTDNGLDSFDGDGGNGGDAVVFDFHSTKTVDGISVTNSGIANARGGDAGLAGNATAENGFAGEARGVDARSTIGPITIFNDGELNAVGGDSAAADRTGGAAIAVDASTATGSLTVVNNGSVTANGGNGGLGTANAQGIITGNADDVIRNTGTVTVNADEYAIRTQGGVDTIDLLDGSAITGIIDTGSGNDIVNISGDVTATRIVLGTGDDHVSITNSIADIPLDFSAGGNNLLSLIGDHAAVTVAPIGGTGTDTLELVGSGRYDVSLHGFDLLRKQADGTWTLNLIEDNSTIVATDIQKGLLNLNVGSSDFAWTGNITGAGQLIKNGSGKLTLHGANSYAGGTFVAAGTLQGNTDTLQGDFWNNGAVVFDQPTDDTFAGSMTGTGSLTKLAGGALTLTGDNAYRGGTTVKAGSIIGDTKAIQGDIVNDASVVFTQPFDGIFAGDMSGSGDLTKLDAGTLTMTGNNSYGGGTNVASGVLRGDTESLQGDILNNAALEFDQNHGGSYDGVITGSGTVTKNGVGNVVFNGDSTYTGDTTVNAGRLRVNGSIKSNTTVNGGVVGGSGTVASLTLNPGSVIAPGNSIDTLTVNGGLTQSAGTIYEAEINHEGTTPGVHSDLIDVVGAPGTAQINGGIVSVLGEPGGAITGRDFAAGSMYTILQAENGVTGPGYDGIVDNMYIRDFQLFQNPNDIQVQAFRIAGNYEANATTANAKAVGKSLDAINKFATGPLGNILDELLLLPAEARHAPVHQMTGDIHASMSRVGLMNTGYVMQLLSDQYGMGGFAFGSGNEVAFANTSQLQEFDYGGSSNSDISLVSYHPEFGGSGSNHTRSGQANSSQRGRTGWMLGYGLSGDIDADGNVDGLGYSIGGTSFAVGRTVEWGKQVGIIGAYSQSSFRNPMQNAQVDSFQLGSFLHSDDGLNYYLLAGMVGFDDYSSQRTIVSGGATNIAQGDNHGEQVALYLERGWKCKLGRNLFTPMGSLQYAYIHQDDFTETGGGALNLTVDDIDTHSLRSYLGARLARGFYLPDGTHVMPSVRAAWLHEFLDTTTVSNNTIGGAPSFAVRGIDLGRDWATTGFGMGISTNSRSTIYLNYQAQFNDRQEFHVGSGGVVFDW